MIIAVLSDTHDNIWKLEEVLKGLGGAQELIFCGDFCAPFTLKQIAEGFAGPVHVVFGNNDGDKLLLSTVATQAGNVTLHGEFAELELGGRKTAVTHYPAIAAGLAASGRYDLVCPVKNLDDLCHAWPELDAVIVPDAGHSSHEPGITRELVAATARIAETGSPVR